ncbi:MAG: hypothetical protein R3C15_17925 [Thermoleophilia bacterium]
MTEPAPSGSDDAMTGMDHGATDTMPEDAVPTESMPAGSTPAETTGAAEPAASAAADLRVTLDRLLGEHAVLAVFAMQKGIDGAEDFESIAGALDANTDDLGDAIGSVYGPDAQEAFEQQWRTHIGFFVDYVTATAKEDEAGRQEALDGLAGYRQAFSQFMAKATGLEADAVAGLLQAHVMQLIEAFDTYAMGDYATAYGQAREAYHHMFMTGDGLAAAIAAQQAAG